MTEQSLPITYNDKLLEEISSLSNQKGLKVLGIILATKPCFIKLWSLMEEAEKKSIPYAIINTGQHFDDLLGFGLKEFDFEDRVAVNLNIRGDLSQKSAELFLKVRDLYQHLKNLKIILIPYVNGDTIVAGIFPAAWLFASNEKCIQGEAGLRAMSPAYPKGFENLSAQDFFNVQASGKWSVLRNEPFPEQWDTFVSAASCQYFFAPLELNKSHLVREAYNPKDIFVTGNTVVDTVNLRKKKKPQESIFELYPQLENGDWLRIDIHRRENLTERRFKSIIGAVSNLVNSGIKVVMIELTATSKALDYYSLRKKLSSLGNKGFLFTPLWKEYAQVMEFFTSGHCAAVLTDSGSLQEEANELGMPCLTCRFSSDRPETVFEAKSNMLIPPYEAGFMSRIIKEAFDTPLLDSLSRSKKLYGENVAIKTLGFAKHILEDKAPVFRWAHEELGLWKDDRFDLNYL
ncbi:MAG: UDP-N-acetylglucosamine 2-epimerase [Candidatus Woesearchaeota archaeon]